MSNGTGSTMPAADRPRRKHSGFTLLHVAGILAIAAVVAGLVWYNVRGRGPKPSELPLLKSVLLGPYEHVVIEQGEVESANNVEIRCEVRARVTSGPSTSIIDIIPEGTMVAKGDWLVTLDSSALEQDQRAQKIAVNSSEATMIQAKSVYDTALIAKTEYLEGSYREQEKTILNQIFVAEEGLKKAQLAYESTKRLVSRGLLTTLQLEGEKFRVDAADNELALAKRKLEVLEQFTKLKMLTQLDSDIRAAEVKWRNEKDSYEEEQTKLKEIEAQIACCKIHAPSAGQVVYANVQSSRSGSEFVVEPGAMVRERQVLLRLPDPTNMQIRATISESRINLVHEGMAVDIRIDAFGDRSLRGEVTKVNKYAEPGNWWSSTAKQYATFIKVFEPPPELRVGLTAEVQIQVERRDQAIQIPVQAVYEKEGRTFCLVQKEAAWETREVVISSTNDKMVALDEERSEQMHAGELVVINPRRHLDKFDSKRLKAADLNGNRSLDITELDAAASRMGAARAPAKTTTPGGGA